MLLAIMNEYQSDGTPKLKMKSTHTVGIGPFPSSPNSCIFEKHIFSTKGNVLKLELKEVFLVLIQCKYPTV